VHSRVVREGFILLNISTYLRFAPKKRAQRKHTEEYQSGSKKPGIKTGTLSKSLSLYSWISAGIPENHRANQETDSGSNDDVSAFCHNCKK